MPYAASKKDWYLDVFNINWPDSDDKSSLVVDLGKLKDLPVHLTVYRETWKYRFQPHHTTDEIFDRIFGSRTGGIHVTLEAAPASPDAPVGEKQKHANSANLHCYLQGPNQGRDEAEKQALQTLLEDRVNLFKRAIEKRRTESPDGFVWENCDDPAKPLDFLFAEVRRDAFERIARLATEKHKIEVVYPAQVDSALLWSSAAVHPLQSLQNTYQRLIRDACRGLAADDATAKEAEELGKYCYFRAVTPSLMGLAKDAPPDVEKQMAEAEKALSKLKREISELKPDALAVRLKAVQEALWKLRQLFDKKTGKAVPSLSMMEQNLKGFDKQIEAAKTSADPDAAFEKIRGRLGWAHRELANALMGMCCIQNFHTIEPFYLFRLLVKFQIQSGQKIASKLRTDVSSTLTGLLHNSPHMEWLFTWLRDKLVQLNKALLEACTEKGPKSEKYPEGEPAVAFYLKGGRAAKYLQKKSKNGENDWDTNIVINPNLRANAWYKTFLLVHNTVLPFLDTAKREFCVLVHQTDNYDKFVAALEGTKAKPPEEQRAKAQEAEAPEITTEKEAAMVEEAERHLEQAAPVQPLVDPEKPAKLEAENCKAELIDIGIPRRDTVEAFEQWFNVCPRIITCEDGIPIPGHLYYIAEYVMMIREAFMDKSLSMQKTPKRVMRLLEVLEMGEMDQTVSEEKEHIPESLGKSMGGVEGLGPPVKRMLLILLKQFSEAYELAEDPDLARRFDEAFAKDLAKRKEKVQYPQAFKDAIAKHNSEQKEEGAKYQAKHEDLADAIGYAQWIAQEFDKHLKDERAKFVMAPEQRKVLTNFVKAIYTASIFSLDEELEVQFAVAGAFAAHLHAEYAKFERMQELEPVKRVELKIYCKPAHDPATVLELIDPLINTYIREATTPHFVPRKLGAGAVCLMWPDSVKFSESMNYKPIMVKVAVERCAEDWPQLAFIRGLPVLSLRDLIWEYKRHAGHVEETFTQRGLKKAIEALVDILTRFENPDPGESWVVPPPTVVAGPSGDPELEGQGDIQARAVIKEVHGLEFIPQSKANWCWAAVSLMMRKYYLKETLSLAEVVREIYPNQDDAQSALRLSRLRPEAPVEGRILTWPKVKEQVEANQPFIFARGGHYWVCYGYEESGSARNLLYWDPLPKESGQKSRMSYDQYVSRVESGGATAQSFTKEPRRVLVPLTVDRSSFKQKDIVVAPTTEASQLRVTNSELRVRLAENKLGEIGAIIHRTSFTRLPTTMSWNGTVADEHWGGRSALSVLIEVEATLKDDEERNPGPGETRLRMGLSK